MAKQHPAPSVRGTGPGATQTYVAGTGASVCISHGPLDPTGVVCLSVTLAPSAFWKVALAFIGRINTYYASSKDVSVLTAMGLMSTSDPLTTAPTELFGMSGMNFFYHVLPADVTAEVASLTALVTAGNINKGGNP